MILFFLIFTLVITLIFFYIYRRLIRPLEIPLIYKRILAVYMLLTPLLTPVSFVLRFGLLTPFQADLIAWFTYLNLGFFSLVLALLILRDISRGLKAVYNGLSSRWPVKRTGGSATPATIYSPSRRRFLVNSVNLGIFGMAGILSGYGVYEARRQPVLKEVEIPISDLPAELHNFRIAQFSDVHVGPTIKRDFVESVVRQINQLHPDLIACTGDVVDGSVAELRSEVEVLKELTAPAGVFFVTGNHEYYSGVLPWIEEMQKLGLTVLQNEHLLLPYKNSKIIVAGVHDYTAGQFIKAHASDPQKAIAGAEAGVVKILLAHQPRNIFAAAAAGFDLQISGHTHGGQYLPWSYLVTLSQPYIAGLHRHDRTWIYVNRGAGYWGPPLRLGIPSEVTLLKLVPQPTTKV
jgi:predicted MPP superfamily phosphohydrolase